MTVPEPCLNLQWEPWKIMVKAGFHNSLYQHSGNMLGDTKKPILPFRHVFPSSSAATSLREQYKASSMAQHEVRSDILSLNHGVA